MLDTIVKGVQAHAYLSVLFTILTWLSVKAAHGDLDPFLARFTPWIRTVVVLTAMQAGVGVASYVSGSSWAVAIFNAIGPIVGAVLAHYTGAPPAPPTAGASSANATKLLLLPRPQ
jgi:hypothetical protein